MAEVESGCTGKAGEPSRQRRGIESPVAIRRGLRPLRGLQETRDATRVESGVLGVSDRVHSKVERG